MYMYSKLLSSSEVCLLFAKVIFNVMFSNYTFVKLISLIHILKFISKILELQMMNAKEILQ